MIKKTLLIGCIGLFISSFGFCQVKSLKVTNTSLAPKIIQIQNNDYKLGPQALSIIENEDGTLIMGNERGVLTFDGEHWQMIKLPNNSPVGCLVKADDGKIYAGGYNEFGIIEKNKFGNYFYKSLLSKYLLDKPNFEHLWNVSQIDKYIIFNTFLKLIVISKNKLTAVFAKDIFLYAGKAGNNYFVQDFNSGIYKLDPKTLKLLPIFYHNAILKESIISIFPTINPNIFTIITRNGYIYTADFISKKITNKIYLFDGLKKDMITCVIKHNDDYLFGTNSSKILKFTNSGGNTKISDAFPEISNITIKAMFQTKNNNIIFSQNNALSLVDFKNPFTKIFNTSSVYDILVKNKRVYIATSAGVYFSDFLTENQTDSFVFNKVKNLEGQAWSIQDVDNDIVISHDFGVFKLENDVAKKLGAKSNFWKITKIKNKKGLFLGSNYGGLFLIEKNGGNWTIKYKIPGFDESSRDIIEDYEPDTYWVCHGYKGIYKIHFNADYSRIDNVEHFTNKNGLKSPFNINVFNWNNKIVFTTNTGIYYYEDSTNTFKLFYPLNNILNPLKNTRQLIVNKGKTWFIQDDEVGYFYNDKPNKLYKNLFMNLKGEFNEGMERIYPIDNNKVLFGTSIGLYLYYLNENQNVFPTSINLITYTQNQKKSYLEISSKKNKIQLPNNTNTLCFEFSNPKMLSSEKIYYSYKLEDVDENWSAWQKNASKEYTHLSAGDYKFVVKSMTLTGLAGKETTFEFNILPKWYHTNLAYFIYIISIVFFVLYIVNYIKIKIAFIKLNAEIKIKNSQRLLELEIEKNALKQEKEDIQKTKSILEEDTINKSKELTNYAISLGKMKDMVDELKTDLKQLRGLLKSEESRKKITEIFQKLNQHKISKEHIELFDVNFEKINTIFFERLKLIDSTLTQKELNICAFVKMNLTNKEIASLINVSSRTIENERYKLRKKLNIQREDNFISFLINLAENSKEE